MNIKKLSFERGQKKTINNANSYYQSKKISHSESILFHDEPKLSAFKFNPNLYKRRKRK